MEWFDDEFFNDLEKVGLVHSQMIKEGVYENPEYKRVLEERDYWITRCSEVEKERDYWKDLFDKKHDGNKKLLETVNVLIKYLE